MKTKIIFILICSLVLFLRVFKLEDNPPGFYSDEASYAYNAFSIIETGKDEYGRSYPTVFEAFGDYKLPVMLYSIAGSFLLFGESDWSARLPGAIYGILSCIGVYLLTQKIVEDKTISKKIGLLSMLIVGIAPSHIFVSRGTWELTAALCCIIFATYFLLSVYEESDKSESLTNKGRATLVASILLYICAIYAYNSARVFVPIFVGLFAITAWKNTLQLIIRNKKTTLLVITISIIATLPILKSITSPQITQRAKYISIFYDKGVDARLFDAIRTDKNNSILETRIVHNKITFYATDFLKRYVSHFSPGFLFLTGDTFEIFRIVDLGFLPIISLPFLIVGIYKHIASPDKASKILAMWILVSPLASSLTIFTPSTSRAMNMIVPLSIYSAYGIVTIFFKIREKHGLAVASIGKAAFVSCVIINTAFIFNRYFIATPAVTAEKWNDGYKELSEYIAKNEKNYDKIVVSSSKAPSYIFLAWYMRYDPKEFQNSTKTNHIPDEHGLNFTSQVGKYHFTKNISDEIRRQKPEEKTLYVGFSGELPTYTSIVYSRNNTPVFELSE